LDVKIFPLSDLILLPLAPTITRTIADYLLSISQQPYLNALQKNGEHVVTDLPQDLYWQWQFQKSIRQIPTLEYQYVSTIAHQLAAKSLLTPLEICQNLHSPILALPASSSSFHLELYCWYNNAGYIYFQLTPKSVEIWLNYIHDLSLNLPHVDCNLPSIDSVTEPSHGRINLAIYAHARCCSLLKLANAEQLVAITDEWQISTPNWLIGTHSAEDSLTARFDRLFEHPVEQRLIQTLMAALDAIYSDIWQLESWQSESISKIVHGDNGHRRSPNWTKLTIDLAQSWLEFYRYCQIFGKIDPRLAIARCGLTAISRRYLQVLLEDYLGVRAAVEL
jgi:hypothetical protein